MPVVLAFILVACTDAPGDLEPTQPPALPTVVDELPAMTPEGFEALLGQLQGTPVVVNVWAAWCEPCKAETPKLVEAADANPDVQFLGVDTMDSREDAEKFIADHGVPYPSIFDPDGSILRALDGIGPPITVFYHADGSVEGTVPGELSQEALDEHLAVIAT
jgi:cytochrome c biogenesis protein CcmG, thiol:disulfide interchange protein DsbE